LCLEDERIPFEQKSCLETFLLSERSPHFLFLLFSLIERGDVEKKAPILTPLRDTQLEIQLGQTHAIFRDNYN
jgi:hypothetical protein